MRQGRGVRDQALELVHRQVSDGLEDLLVGPADLARLLEEVVRGPALAVEGRLEERQQGGLALVAAFIAIAPKVLTENQLVGASTQAEVARSYRRCELARRNLVSGSPVPVIEWRGSVATVPVMLMVSGMTISLA